MFVGLLFYVGAVLVMKGLYTFEKLLQVFSLIIFSVTFAGQIVGSGKPSNQLDLSKYNMGRADVIMMNSSFVFQVGQGCHGPDPIGVLAHWLQGD